MSIRTPVNPWLQLAKAQHEAMDKLLRAWDEEIERSFEQLREQQKEIHAEKLADYVEARQHHSQDTVADILADSIADRLESAAILAQSSDAPIAIPAGIQVAGTHIHGPELGEIASLFSEALDESLDRGDDPNAASIRFALEHGFLPHPRSISEQMGQVGVEGSAPAEFGRLADALEKLDSRQERIGRLKLEAAGDRLEVFRDLSRNLQALGPNAIVALAAQPSALAGQKLSAAEPAKTGASTKQLGKILDQIGFGVSNKS